MREHRSAVDPLTDVLLRGAVGQAMESSRSNSRAALLDAAFDEFTTRGYEATTVAAIAHRAGVTTGALYAHFGGKLDLLLATVGLTPVEDIERSIDEMASLPRTATANLLTQGLTTPPDERTLLLLDVIVVARRDPRIADVLRTGLDAYIAATTRALDAGIRTGAVEPTVATDDLARLLGLINLGMLVFAALAAHPPSPNALTELAHVLLRSAQPDAEDDRPAALVRVRGLAADATRAQEDLHDAIVEAVADGHSLRQVGAAAGMSHERIRQVRSRNEAR